MDKIVEKKSATGSGDTSHCGHRTHSHQRHRRHRRRSATNGGTRGGGGAGSDPFQPVGLELFDLGQSPSSSKENAAWGAHGVHGALPPFLGGDPRRRAHTRDTRAPLSSSSSSSSSAPGSQRCQGLDQAAERSPIQRRRDGTIVILDREALASHHRRRNHRRTHRGSSARSSSSDSSSGTPTAGAAAHAVTRQREDKQRRHEPTSAQSNNTAISRTDTGARSHRRRHMAGASGTSAPAPDRGGGKAEQHRKAPSGVDESDDKGGSTHYDYDPDDMEALNEKQALLSVEVVESGVGTFGGLVCAPAEFQFAPIPYWVHRVSDLMLFHNGNGGAAAEGLLPVDSALLQLRADLREARALLREVESGRDWGFLRSRPASLYEVYGPESDDNDEEDCSRSGNMSAAVGAAGIGTMGTNGNERLVQRRSSNVIPTTIDASFPFEKEMRPMMDGNRNDAGQAPATDTVAVPMRDTAQASPAMDDASVHEAAVVVKCGSTGPYTPSSTSAPLLPAAEEARDEARPLLQREIPLWRRRGAAARTVRDLISLLESRVKILQRKLSDPVDGAWFEAVGSPNSSGVDGTQRTTLAPAVEQAYATTVTNAILSDLFHQPADGSLKERAARMSMAFTAHAPNVHDQFVVEEYLRPVYDYLLAGRCRSREMLSATPSRMSSDSGSGGAEETARRSFTVHVDYVRLHPPPSPGVLLAGGTGVNRGKVGAFDASAQWNEASRSLGVDEWGAANEGTFSRLLADTQHYTSLLSGDLLEDTLMMADSVVSMLQQEQEQGHQACRGGGPSPPPRRASVESLTFDPAAAAALSLLSVATAQKNALITFSPETYLISALLQHYERYRLLTLNLMPHLKSRAFYEEQLTHLSRQPLRTPDMDVLQRHVQTLRNTAADVERAALTAMIALWRAVSHLRGQSATAGNGEGVGVPFIVSSRQAARVAALSQAASYPSAQSAPSPPWFQQQQQQRLAPGQATAIGGTGNGGGVGAGTSEVLRMAADGTCRRNVQELDLLEADSSADSEGEPPRTAATAAAATMAMRGTLGSAPASLFARTGQARRAPGGAGFDHDSSVPSATHSLLLGASSNGASHSDASHLHRSPQDGNTNMGSHDVSYVRSATRARALRFSLRRVGHVAETPYIEGDDVLNYEPVLEGADALPPAVGSAAAVPSPRISRAQLDGLQFFQVAVFARASAAVPPQYVGCTLPRPLSAAQVVFFNESFEIRVLREPVEIILHLLCVSDGPGKGAVVATIRLQPTLTRSYLLLPLQAPVSFVFRKRLLRRYHGAALSGVLAASTTWTTAQGLTINQIEGLFMSGAADPLNPEYAPLLRMLKNYYMEVDRNQRERNTTPTPSALAATARTGKTPSKWPQRRARGLRNEEPAAFLAHVKRREEEKDVEEAAAYHEDGGSRRRYRSLSTVRMRSGAGLEASTALVAAVNAGTTRRRRSFTPQALREAPTVGADPTTNASNGGTIAAGGGGGLASTMSERLLFMRHRWLIVCGLSKPIDQIEAALLRYPIPLSESEQYDLLRRVRRALTREAAERRKALISEGSGCSDDGGGVATTAIAGDRAPLFDEKAYHAEPTSVSGLALSPLPKEVKLKLWQDRQRHIKLTRKPIRYVTDEEKLGQIVTIPTLSLKVVFDLTPRSQLNPRRVARPKNEDIDRELLNRRRDSRIVVHVMKANNLPDRANGTPLEPFVQAAFVYENAYSRCEVGTSPTWFQTLELPFQPLDFDEDTLRMIDDDIVISLYDKVEMAMPPSTITTGAVAHETHYRTERRLLGTLRLPFYSLHQAAEARMEGVFPLQTPRWLLGYNIASADLADAAPNPFCEHPTRVSASDRSVSSGPTIQLYVSLWPPLQREKSTSMSFSELTLMVRQLNASTELRYLHEVALKWQKSATSKLRAISRLNAQATAREVEPFVNCSTGDLVLVCRYLLPHGGPPPSRTVTNIFEAVRYVSLLPFVVDILTWGDKDVWSTNVELLAMRNGDYEELALLLVHFLRYLAPDCASYVVVGEGDIYAQTIMVLHAFEGREWRLIDPRTGFITPVERPFGSIMRDVQFVVSHDQLWANIQLSGLPHRMTWDFHNPAYWMSCFDLKKDKQLARCMPFLTSIQREVLTYQPVDPLKVKEIEVDLRAALKQSLLSWRNHRPPAYHRGVEAILRDLLAIAEDERCACGTIRHPAVTATARERLAEYFGMPVDGVTFAEATGTNREASKRERHRRRHRDGRTGKSTTTSTAADGEEGDEEQGGTGSNLATAKASAAPFSVISGRRRQGPCLTLVGAPVTSSYNSADRRYNQILQQVFECAVHEVGTDDVSFAAGVYVKGYTGDVFAMWVFLVAICRGVEEVPDSDEEGCDGVGATGGANRNEPASLK